jgi:Arc/MetJ-type ribon-helix-helix transcriptional regulator
MPRSGYKSIVIPEVLYKEFVQYVENSQGRYVTVSEVVRKAIWEYLQKAPSSKAS